jgi:hypothetical protein
MHKYDPAYCNKIIELASTGCNVHQLARGIGVSTATLYNWVTDYPEFAEAKEQAQTNYLAWLSDVANDNFLNRNFNSRTHELMWVGANYHASQRALKRGIADTPNPTHQCYLIINALLEGVIAPDRAEVLINLITNTHKLIDIENIKREFELIKSLTGVAKDGVTTSAPAVS